MSKSRRPFLPIVILFVVLNGFFIAGRGLLERWDASQEVLISSLMFAFLPIRIMTLNFER